ncbi:ClcB-like voltage-gated chloride channel protein [Ramlibacter sp. H39-3-26]|uniref:ClcB-like voltage-gated chloride channel protein n=1 Tax=Curvibacter soli TaxID=3031331 RepID=UPI0023DC4404|nr:ClcB-like voltage-gated chloride channel protein [Ramlibacter sp. H39-3-26]MDF1484663.1 ClcB-like voltage-gated chloride channel protein [Ramlibacter sp. H39-3-26]
MQAGLAQRLLAWRLRLQQLLRITDWQVTLLWAIAAGVLGALATEGFRLALDGLDRLALGRGGSLVAIARSLPVWARILVPTAGGLAAGLLLAWAHRGARQPESADYMEAIVVGDGRIPVAQTLARSASSLASIASGGSIGREGPMVQLAALGASLLGRALRLPTERLRLLVACGGAAGITAAYNAPIAGAFFIAEIVLGSIAMESLGPIMVAAVVANIVMRALPGYAPAYEMPAFPVVTGPEVLLFALLGLLVGPAAALTFRGLHAARAAFARVPLALPWRLALGGLVVGLISAAVPEVWGNGYSVVNGMLHQPMAWLLLVALLAAKAAATLATVGSGAVGGMFTPALFFGCAIGTLFGQAAQALWPGAASAPFAYGIVGMGAFLAAATQAPLMAVLMIFEMTLSYEVMLPLMATSVVAYFIARSMRAPSMFGITAMRRAQEDQRLRLRAQHMRDLVQPAETVVGPDAGVQAMSRLFLQYPVKYLYVVDAAQRYLGVVPLKALGAQAAGGAAPALRAADLLTQEIAPLTADMALGPALQRFLDHRGERLPVVESAAHPVLIGVVYKSALLDTYVRLSDQR